MATNNSLSVIESIENSIAEANDRKLASTLDKLSYVFEEGLLYVDGMPEDYFAFLLQSLSNESYYSMPNIWKFLFVMNTETHRLDESQFSRLSEAIKKSYVKYKDEMLCLTVCDFIARNYEYRAAKTLLLSLADMEKQMSESGFAHDGLRILELEKQRATQ